VEVTVSALQRTAMIEVIVTESKQLSQQETLLRCLVACAQHLGDNQDQLGPDLLKA